MDSSAGPSTVPSSAGFSSPPTFQEALNTFREKHLNYRRTLDNTHRCTMTAQEFIEASQKGSRVVGVSFEPKKFDNKGYNMCLSEAVKFMGTELFEVTAQLSDDPYEREDEEAKRNLATAVVSAANASFGESSGHNGPTHRFVELHPKEFSSAVQQGAHLANVWGTRKKIPRNSSTAANWD
jgi:hypothetical protein